MKWAPNAPLNAPVLRAATGGSKEVPFEWMEAMEEEFNFLKKEMKKSLKLSPYNPDQKLRLIIDGSRTVGTGYILVQYINDDNVEEGIKIINAGSALLPQDRDFSAMEAECIALDRAMVSCHHWLYHCPEIELVTDCQGLIGWLNKHTADIENRSLQKILERASNYSWQPKYIRGVDNRVADALSRLCKEVSTYSFKYDRKLPRLMTISTRKALRVKQVETEDPLIAKLAETGAEDPEYIDMIKSVQEDNLNIPKENEIKKIKDHKSCLSIVTLESGNKLVIRNDCEILVPKQARQKCAKHCTLLTILTK